MLERINLLFEIISILLILWSLHGSRKKPGICTIIYVCLELIIVSMVGEGWISSKYTIFAYIGIAIIDYIEFDDTLKKAIMYMVVDCVVLFALQALGIIVYLLIFNKERISFGGAIIVNSFLLCAIIFVFIKCNVKIYISSILEMKYVVDSILMILVVITLVIIKRECVQMPIDWNLLVFLIIFSFITILVSMKLARERIQKNNYINQLQQYEQYNLVYKELIADIRHKQHDFNNHLQAIYSMAISCNNIEELRDEQKKYFEELIKDNRNYHLLKENVSSVLMAYLYIKFSEMEKDDIYIDYRINIDKFDKFIPFPDIVELIGNLLDNAIEATKKAQNKRISFYIDEISNCVNLLMENPYNWEDGESFDKFMIDGKSTNGKKRGLGLTNIRKVINRYKGLIKVNFDYNKEVKIIRFEIIIPLKRERQ